MNENDKGLRGETLGVLMDRASRALHHKMQQRLASKGYEITVEQWMVLLLLWEKDGQFQQQLANSIEKNKGTISPQIGRLENRNLVLRVPDKKDRRQNLVYLTNKGKELKEDLLLLGLENVQHAQKGIAPEDMDVCKKVLAKICANLSTK
jgi:DNA-binding MarR family transcriptional regulator